MTYELLQKGIQEELISLPKELFPQILNYLRLLKEDYLCPKENRAVSTNPPKNKDIMDCLKIIAPSIYEARMKDPTIFSETDDFDQYLEMARDKSEFQRSSELQLC